MEETKTHTCYIEVDGNVITRDANGTLIQEFTGNWSVLHKVYRFATLKSKNISVYHLIFILVVLSML